MDLGKKESQVTILSEAGELIEKRMRTERERLVEYFKDRPKAKILMEASTIATGSSRCFAAWVEKLELPEHLTAEVDSIHAEALVRWRHPVYGLMPPDEFIPLAEQSGNIGIITKWVFKRAIEDCAGWNRAGFDLGVAVNLSALDLYDAELPTLVSGLLHDQKLDPSKLVLEITESAVMKDAAYALKTLRDVKTRGITLAIDDFGTGYSSLAHLKRLPLDELTAAFDTAPRLDEGVAVGPSHWSCVPHLKTASGASDAVMRGVPYVERLVRVASC